MRRRALVSDSAANRGVPMRSPISLAAAATLFMLAVAVHSSAQGGAPQAQGRGGRAGGGRATFPAQQRPPGDPALIARGNGLYGVHCRACHGVDLRGGDQGGPNLLRSDLVLNDQAGELIVPVILNGQQRAAQHAADPSHAGRCPRDRRVHPQCHGDDARPGESPTRS